MTESFAREFQLAQSAANQSGARLLQLFGQATVTEKDSSQNLVTQADLEAEAIISNLIADQFPSHCFLREEAGATGELDAEHLWIIDPLDATNNYAHGIPHFSVSIAYARQGRVMAGVVFDPLRKEMFTAVRGNGASLNGTPIQVSARAQLRESILSTGFYYDRGLLVKRTLQAIGDLFARNIRGIRRMGSAAIDLSWVACGRFEGFFEYRLAPWDYAAGSLLIEEAGGRCYDREGQPFSLGAWNIVAANGIIDHDLIETVRWTEA